MKDKKHIYHIITIFLLILIAVSPVLAENLKSEEKADNGKFSNPNNIITAKAATTNEPNDDCCSPNNPNESVDSGNSTNNTNNTNSNDKTPVKAAGSDSGPKKLSQAQILKASVYINNFVAKNKKLPNKVNIDGYDFSIGEYTYLLSKTIHLKYNKKNSDIVVKYNIKDPSSPSGTKIKGRINSKQYSSYAKNLFKYIEKNNRIPNYVNTKLGRMQYQTAVYGLNKILYWSYYNKNKMPSSLALNIAKNHKMNKVVPKYTRVQSFNHQTSPNMDNIFDGDFTIIKTKFAPYGPTQVMYNLKCLISTGRCSCGKTGDYNYHEASFKNYCPYCKVSGCMVYKEASKYPEGLWLCTRCGADFCLVTGKEHIIISPKWLTPY